MVAAGVANGRTLVVHENPPICGQIFKIWVCFCCIIFHLPRLCSRWRTGKVELTLWRECPLSKKVYVGNLSFNATEEQVRSLFAEFGTVESVAMITDRESGRFRGFCFVEMPAAEADAAIQALDGREVEGRNLKVNEARPREERPGGGGRRGGGGYRGGGGNRGGGSGNRGGGGYRGGGGGNRRDSNRRDDFGGGDEGGRRW